jgi:hypothetical protein
MSSQNGQQYIGVLIGFIGDFTSIILSNILIYSIPLRSPYDIWLLSPMETSIFIVNLSTLLIFIYLHYIEIKREFWLIKHFDYSRRYNSLHLQTYKSQYPALFEFLNILNSKYYRIYYITRIAYLINFLASAIYILAFNYSNYTTPTTLFTNIWFCWSKLASGITIASQSIKDGIGYSYYNKLNLSYNRIDIAYKTHQSNSNMDGGSGASGESPNSISPIESLNNSLNAQSGRIRYFMEQTDIN